MPAEQAEAVVLRTSPIGDQDKLCSFLTRDRGVNLAGVRTLFELEERLGKRILEALYDEGTRGRGDEPAAPGPTGSGGSLPCSRASRASRSECFLTLSTFWLSSTAPM